MRKSFLLVALLVFLLTGACKKETPEATAHTFKVGIVFTEPHPVLQTIIDSFVAELKKTLPGVQILQKHANGSKAQYPAVVRSMISENPDLLVPITTPMTIESVHQAQGRIPRIPVLFLGVTDPLGAGVVKDLKTPQLSSGVSDNPPMQGVVELTSAFIPGAKTLGIPYDPKDQPGVVTMKRTVSIAEQLHLNAKPVPVLSENDLRAAVRGLSSSSDAIIIGMDNMMMKNAGIISDVAREQNRPVFAADDKSVAMGALAGVGVNYSDVGTIGARMAVKILRDGISVGNLPVEMLATGDTFINEQAASRIGVTIPASIRSKSHLVQGPK